MFPRSIRMGALGGVDIRVDPSWFPIALLVAANFWYLLVQAYGHPAAVAVVAALAAAAAFFASVLAHELAHALEARHRGIEVAAITLFLFGGVTETGSDVRRPRDEFALAAVGPYASFVLAAALGLVATAASYAARSSSLWIPVADVAGVLGWLNLGLAAFNVLPGAPLDGGRILRSAVWAATGDRRRSVRVGARAGQVLGGLLVAYAAYRLMFHRDWGMVWLALIGWFLFRAAATEHAAGGIATRQEGRTAGTAAPPVTAVVAADATVSDALDTARAHGATALPVQDEGVTVGAVLIDSLTRVLPSDRSRRMVREVLHPQEQVPVVPPAASLKEAADRLRRHDVVAVVAGERLVGLLTRHELEGLVGASLGARDDRRAGRTGRSPRAPHQA
ncbi:MAG TPA: site-2 protease family protein [Nitriliruptorales bacterium]|nr:site-2 protease family protein [Nitriliruptorales bacterium]